jgi:uracil-DNA glycosylase
MSTYEAQTENTAGRLTGTWLELLEPELSSDRGQKLRAFLSSAYLAGKTVYPEKKNYFRAFLLTPFETVKMVILGQDPYHGPGQAHGLSFSVGQDVDQPPSLRNIFKELVSDVGLAKVPACGDLSSWAHQGVLLLNTVLTVEKGLPASHQGKGWEEVTDRAIRELSERRKNLVFVLWGAHAQKKAPLIEGRNHLVIESPHPSPLSAHRGFFGSKPFSRANSYLKSHGQRPIDWSL